MPDEPGDVAGLREAINKLLGRLKPDDEGGDEDDPRSGRSVSYDRFVKVNERRKAAETGLADITARLEQIEANYAEKVREMQTKAAADVGAIATRHAEDLQLVQLNMDDAGRAELRRAWSSLPEDGRPKSSVDWWTSQVEAHKAHVADPTKPAATVPRTLALYLPEVAKPEPEAPAAPQGRGGVRIGAPFGGVDAGAQPRGGSDMKAKLEAASTPGEFFKLLETMRG